MVEEGGFLNFTNGKKPIHGPADFQGLRFRAMDPSQVALYEAFGASGTPIPWTELYMGLRTGVADGQMNPTSYIILGSLYQVQKYLTLANIQYSDQFLVANGDLLASLPAKERQALLDAAAEATRLNREAVAAQQERDLAFLKEKGMQIIQPSADDLAAFREKGQPSYLAWLKTQDIEPRWTEMAFRDAGLATAPDLRVAPDGRCRRPGAPVRLSGVPPMPSLLKGMRAALLNLATLLLLLDLVLLIYGVFARYLLGSSPIWMDELARYLIIGAVMLALGAVWMEGGHMRVNLLEQRLPPRLAQALRLYQWLLALAFFAFAAWVSTRYALNAGRFRSLGLGVSRTWPLLSLPLGFGLLTLMLLLQGPWRGSRPAPPSREGRRHDGHRHDRSLRGQPPARPAAVPLPAAHRAGGVPLRRPGAVRQHPAAALLRRHGHLLADGDPAVRAGRQPDEPFRHDPAPDAPGQRPGRPLRGGLGHVNVVAGVFFAGVNGSAAADASALSTLLVPAMEKEGYSRRFAAGLTAGSSLIGPIIPPSIFMILYSSLTNTSVGELFLAGVIPGLLLAAAFMLLNAVYAYRNGLQARHAAPAWGEILAALSGALTALIAPVIIVAGIVLGLVTPTESGALIALYVALVGLLQRQLSLVGLWNSLRETVRLTASIYVIIAAASVVNWLLNYAQVASEFAQLLEPFGHSPTLMLFIISAVIFVCGMLMEEVSVLMLLTPIVAPVALAAGVDQCTWG